MKQYIDKDDLVAEIERRRDLHYKYYVKNGAGSIAECKYDEDREILSFIDTLEVKEVDLEKEAEKYADRITAELYRRSDKHYDKEKKCMSSVLYNVNWSEIGKEMEKCFIEGAKWKTKEE